MAGPTPSQTVGPFFHYGLTDRHAVTDLAGPETRGRRIVLTGRVLDAEGEGVPDAMIEIWQANCEGKYDHPEDKQDKPLDPVFRGFGRCATDEAGGYRFRTIMPGPVPSLGNALQAPHILVNVFARGLLKQLVTRIYFEGESLNDSDPVLALIDDRARRDTLIARAAEDSHYVFDIRLAGEQETVFFET
jgi:protocatechuate 3,4-dioxygenase, alpha subunit